MVRPERWGPTRWYPSLTSCCLHRLLRKTVCSINDRSARVSNGFVTYFVSECPQVVYKRISDRPLLPIGFAMLPPTSSHDGSEESLDTVVMIGDALRQKFGAEALAVAELQRNLSNEETPAKWDEIVAHLKE